jgi:hypothetical protein
MFICVLICVRSRLKIQIYSDRYKSNSVFRVGIDLKLTLHLSLCSEVTSGLDQHYTYVGVRTNGI